MLVWECTAKGLHMKHIVCVITVMCVSIVELSIIVCVHVYVFVVVLYHPAHLYMHMLLAMY